MGATSGRSPLVGNSCLFQIGHDKCIIKYMLFNCVDSLVNILWGTAWESRAQRSVYQATKITGQPAYPSKQTLKCVGILLAHVIDKQCGEQGCTSVTISAELPSKAFDRF